MTDQESVNSLTAAKRERFERLVRQSEEELKHEPQRYRNKVLRLTLLGYSVIFGVILSIVGVIALILVGSMLTSAWILWLFQTKIIWVMIAVAALLFKAMWVRVAAPQGTIINHKDAPGLFEDIERIRVKADSPKVHEVYLTDDFNAGVSQVPRWGITGGSRNYLVLGLPLLVSLSRDEMCSVLAHEFGHLSRNHARFNAWIYRLRITWWRIMEAFDVNRGWASHSLRRFFDWYAPYFNAYSFALARANEYEVDRLASQVTSPMTLMAALGKTAVFGKRIEDQYWTPLYDTARCRPEPPRDVYTNLADFVKNTTLSPEICRQELSTALSEVAVYADTHPPLKDRISALGMEPQTALVSSEQKDSAAEAYFGDQLAGVLARMDRAWAEANVSTWQQVHQEHQERRDRFEELKRKPAQALPDDELLELACYTEELVSAEDALPIYKDFLQRQPNNAAGQFHVGRLLLARNDRAGLAHMDAVMGDASLTIPACHLVLEYMYALNDHEGARKYQSTADCHQDELDAAREERETLRDGDEFEPHGLCEEDLTSVLAQLRRRRPVEKAWLCRKKTRYFPDHPILTLVILVDFEFCHAQVSLQSKYAQELKMPHDFLVLTIARESRKSVLDRLLIQEYRII